MKWWLWIIVVLNLLLFGYSRLGGPAPEADMAAAGHEPLQPEKLVLLTAAELAALPGPVGAVAPPAAGETACYEWGGLPGDSLLRAQQELQKIAVASVVRTRADAGMPVLYLENVTAGQVAALGSTASGFHGSELRQVSCR